ncbi:transcription factor MYBS3-like [Euphorbia lathyris]|uniref:transcription factor MYBS3-like n=1 Tax=Euphorbia lathyris TaxID=212925 RepID=UPI003313E5D5
MGRKCSQCGNVGHNLRTCTFNTSQSFRLFGVQLNLTCSSSSFLPINDSQLPSMASSSSSSSSSSSYNSSSASVAVVEENDASDELIGPTQQRKKGVAWTEEEHRMFLLGLEKLGKGDWRGISRDFVTTRTPSQVASHSQKFFLRQISPNKRNRRPSLLDMETCQPPIQSISEHNNFCGLTFDTRKASFGDDFSSINLDYFASNNTNLQPDLDLKLNSISSFNASK